MNQENIDIPEANLDYRDCDQQIWEEELADFVPSRILDSHIHFFWSADLPGAPQGLPTNPQIKTKDNDLNTLNQWAKILYPGRPTEHTRLLVTSITVGFMNFCHMSKWSLQINTAYG